MGDQRVVPDFFVIGAYRSGTTFLYRSVRQHPDVFVPVIKEPNFFAVHDNPAATPELLARSVTEPHRYDDLYRAAGPTQRTGDMSPEYLRNPAAPARIHRSRPEAPLVAILRNPVDRAWSDYLMHRSRGTERCPTFAQALEQQASRADGTDRSGPNYLDSGRYHEQLTRYFRYFDADQLLVLLYDDLLTDPGAVVRLVFEHIGVDPSIEVVLADGVNAGGAPKNALVESALRVKAAVAPRVSPKIAARVGPLWQRVLRRGLTKTTLEDTDRHALRELYSADVEALQALINRDLGHWLAD